MGANAEVSKSILLVEDNPDDALFAKRAFAKVCPDARLNVARDGEMAVHYLSGTGEYQDRSRYPLPSLILLDLKLPRKSGLEVLEWLRSTPGLRDIPVMVLTSSSHPQDQQRARELGIVEYYVKPVATEAFLEMARSICQVWASMG